jgi:hypothetical protein
VVFTLILQIPVTIIVTIIVKSSLNERDQAPYPAQNFGSRFWKLSRALRDYLILVQTPEPYVLKYELGRKVPDLNGRLWTATHKFACHMTGCLTHFEYCVSKYDFAHKNLINCIAVKSSEKRIFMSYIVFFFRTREFEFLEIVGPI